MDDPPAPRLRRAKRLTVGPLMMDTIPTSRMLIKEGVIDEHHIFVNTTAIGNDITIIKSLDRTQKFSAIQSKFHSCGKAVLSYKPKYD